MRNIWKALVALGLTAALSVPLAACSEPSAQTEQEEVYAAYVAYAQAAGEEPLSYEEWLESVRGPQGEKGDKGDTGAAGQDGTDGEDGVGIADITYAYGYDADADYFYTAITFELTNETQKTVILPSAMNPAVFYVADDAQMLCALLDAGAANVKLGADISADVVVGEDAEVTLDLGGYTLTNVSGHTITNYGTLTVIDSVGGGAVDNVTHARAALHNDVGAVAVLSGGAFTRSKEAGSIATQSGQNSFYNIRNYGDMTINSGVTVMQSGAFSSLLENGWYDGSQNTSEAPARLTINGGVFSGGLNTIKNDDWGEMTINGGSFENVSQAAVLNWNVANIHGGTYEITGNAQAVILNGHINETMDKGILSVKGVEYTGAPLLAWMSGSGSKDAGTITVYDAQTLQAAIDIAADKTVVLGADIVVGSQGNSATGLTIANKDVTLDFHGFTLENVGLGFALHITGASANVVLRDSSAAQSGGVYGGQGGDNQAVRMDGGATVRIDGGNYTVGGDANGLGNSCISIASDSVVSVYGGTFSCETAYNGKYYVLNVQQTTGAAGEFTVYGGTFVNYDPSTGDDALSGNFIAEGYEVVSSEDGDGNTLYTVQKAE